MINIMKMRLFPYFNKQIVIPTNDKTPYNVIFFSENDNFMSTYTKLNIRRQFVKRITYLPYKMPRLLVLSKTLMEYRKKLALLPVSKPDNNNTFIDATMFFNRLDLMYKKGSYKRGPVFTKAVDYLKKCSEFGGYKSILMYHVNLTKDVPIQILNRRSFVLVMLAKMSGGSLPFDNVVLALEDEKGMKFVSIYNNTFKKPLPYNRIFTIFRQLTPHDTEEEDLAATDTRIDTPDSAPIPAPANIPVKEVPVLSPVQQQDTKEKESILRAIDKYKTKKVLTS